MLTGAKIFGDKNLKSVNNLGEFKINKLPN